MSGFDFDSSELSRLSVGLGDVSRRALPAARQAVTKTCADITRQAQLNIIAMDAVDTGNMLGGMGYDVTTIGTSVVGEVGPQAAYARYVHDGTSRMPGRPFLTNAFDACAPRLEAALEQIATRFGIFGDG